MTVGTGSVLDPAPRRPDRLWWVLAAGVVALTVGLRLVVVALRLSPFEADSAVTGLMARRIVDGDHFLFFAGQRYMGSAEQYGTAVLVAAFGEDRFTLRLVSVLLAGVACALVVAVFSRLATPRRGLVAGLVYAVGTSASLLYSVYPRGAHLAAQVLCLVALALCVRATTFGAARIATLTALVGIGLWLSATTLTVLAPLAVWYLPALLDALRRSRRTLAAAVGGALLGLVWLPVALATGGWSWSVDVRPEEAEPYVARLWGVLVHQVPQAYGVESGFYGNWSDPANLPLVPGVPGWLLVLPAYLLLVVVAVRHRDAVGMWWRELRAAVARPLPTSPPTSRRSPRGVVVLVLLVVPFAVAVSALSFRTGEPRYLVPAFPLLACSLVLVGAGPAPDGAPSWWRRPAVSAVLAAVLVVASASTTVAWLAREAGARHGGPSAEECYDAAADALAAAGVRHVAGSYWQVQPLDLAGRGRLDVRQTRIKDEFAGTMPAPDAPGPWALAADGPRERALFASVLTGGGHTFTATSTCAGLTTFTAITPALTPSEVADPRFYNWFGN